MMDDDDEDDDDDNDDDEYDDADDDDDEDDWRASLTVLVFSPSTGLCVATPAGAWPGCNAASGFTLLGVMCCGVNHKGPPW